VPMLIIEVPFGKWSHLFYRPLAIFLATVKEKASKDSSIRLEDVSAAVGETFMSCLQCGTCTSVCPWNQVGSYSPRGILRRLALDTGSEETVDKAAWRCVTCNACAVNCPRGIEITEVIRSLRGLNVSGGRLPASVAEPLDSLKANGNPWNGVREQRLAWTGNLDLPIFAPQNEYCLFTCCTTAYDPGSRSAGQALLRLLTYAGISFGTLGGREICCGDPAHQLGAGDLASAIVSQNTELFARAGVRKILTTSPHCLNAFKNNYNGSAGSPTVEHYTELLDRLVREGRLRPLLEAAVTVTYHDPCYLGRHNGIYEAPRRVLQSIPELTLVEMADNQASSLCCGGGGGGAWSEVPPSRRLGVQRVEQALGSGAEVVATACPYCSRMLNEAIEVLGVADRIVVRDLADLLLQSVIMEDEVKMKERVDLGIDREVCNV